MNVRFHEAHAADRCGHRQATPVARAARVQARNSGLTAAELRRLQDFLAGSLSQRVHIRQLGFVCGLSRSHFARQFLRTTGMTPYRWILQVRIACAKKLLAESEVSLSEIALTVGFSDQSHFTRVFGKQVGSTPGIWRAQRR